MRVCLPLPFFLIAIVMHVAADFCISLTLENKDDDRPRAMIYRGKAACEGCPESVETLLKQAYPTIDIIFAGPDEATHINSETLGQVEIFVQPGGPDLDRAWQEAKSYAPDVRAFVANGGISLGFCLGAFLAGPHQGFGLIPVGDRVVREIERPNSQVDGIEDTVIQVDWTFSTSKKRGTKDNNRWLYFQDGATIILSDGSPTIVLARYSSNHDVAATLNAYGSGWVANISPHPEADQSWLTPDDLAEISNPEGIQYDIGIDFVRAAVIRAFNCFHHRKHTELEVLRDLISADEG